MCYRRVDTYAIFKGFEMEEVEITKGLTVTENYIFDEIIPNLRKGGYLKEQDCKSCNQLKKDYDALKSKLDTILKLADDLCFCPECGEVMGGHSHFCESCKERVVQPIDQEWFLQYLKKKYRIVVITTRIEGKQLNPHKPHSSNFNS